MQAVNHANAPDLHCSSAPSEPDQHPGDRIDKRDDTYPAIGKVRSSPFGERTKISIYNHRHGKTNDSLQIDMSYSSLRTDLVGKPPETAPFRLSSDGKVRLRIFLDRSLIEVFADNGECFPEWTYPRKGIDKLFPLFSRQCAVARVYPLQEESNGISLFAIGGEAKVVSMDVWQMRSIWQELRYREGQ